MPGAFFVRFGESASADSERRQGDGRGAGGRSFLFWREAASRRPPLRVRPPLGRWGVAHEFTCTQGSKAGLCPWPLVTGTDCAGALKEMISRVLDSLAGNPLSRAFARVRKKGNVGCRSLGTRRALALPRVPSPHLANDHQMTPPLHGPLTALRALAAFTGGSAVGHAFGGPPT